MKPDLFLQTSHYRKQEYQTFIISARKYLQQCPTAYLQAKLNQELIHELVQGQRDTVKLCWENGEIKVFLERPPLIKGNEKIDPQFAGWMQKFSEELMKAYPQIQTIMKALKEPGRKKEK